MTNPKSPQVTPKASWQRAKKPMRAPRILFFVSTAKKGSVDLLWGIAKQTNALLHARNAKYAWTMPVVKAVNVVVNYSAEIFSALQREFGIAELVAYVE
jgi:hypothetical protein